MELPAPRSSALPRLIVLGAVALFILIFGQSLAKLWIDYQWWNEMGQVSIWLRTMQFQYETNLVEWLIFFVVLWICHARGMKYAGTGLGQHPWYGRLTTIAAAVLAMVLTAGAMDGWTVARYFAGSGLETAWKDPVFGKPLAFYFFELPFYNRLLGFLQTLTLAGAIVYYVTARLWQLSRAGGGINIGVQISWDEIKGFGKLETWFFKLMIALFLVFLGVNFWLNRFDMVYTEHGQLFVGVDYLQERLGLPLQNLKAAAAILAAILVLAKQRKLAAACALILVVDAIVPGLVNSFYVKPNELALQRPYIQRHIEATRAGFGITQKSHDIDFRAKKDAKIDLTRNKPTLDNVRLWDWRAFHDTLSQSQPLRPYSYADTDVDRYTINGQLRQILVAPRELDLGQLGEARSRWINTALTFTHGYGLVLAESNRIADAGLPELMIHDAPLQVVDGAPKVSRPEIYYGEKGHEPIFVPSGQTEFNYPSGSKEVNTSYAGKGGFPIGASLSRFIATIAEGDWNIVLSNSIRDDSRMLIHRSVRDRLGTLANFITWDADPYIVIGADGRLTWMVDGYMTTDLFPYSHWVQTTENESYNYIRNSVKATIDAYDGSVKLYVFDEEDPLVRAYRNLFPSLFTPASAMPADLRAHVRAPETMFHAQAEVYRTYHMKDPDLFYNKADQWDLATSTTGQGAGAVNVTPTYVVATVPGESSPEFLLSIAFTPRGKQNLIGMMLARCDGDKLGELDFLQLPKEEILPGPIQIDALINQDQVISKDLTLWNQQGSQVLRPPILTLPMDNTFLYVAPIYIQAAEARMPQLKKVVLAVGSTLVYEDSYERALSALASVQAGRAYSAASAAPPSAGAPTPAPAATSDNRLDSVRQHLQRYRELTSQGKLADAGKELEAIDALVKK